MQSLQLFSRTVLSKSSCSGVESPAIPHLFSLMGKQKTWEGLGETFSKSQNESVAPVGLQPCPPLPSSTAVFWPGLHKTSQEVQERDGSICLALVRTSCRWSYTLGHVQEWKVVQAVPEDTGEFQALLEEPILAKSIRYQKRFFFLLCEHRIVALM